MNKYVEIERRFLVDPKKLSDQHPYITPHPNYIIIQQGYLSVTPPVVRVRVEKWPHGSEVAYITAKGKGEVTRKEVNVRIDLLHARELMKMTVRSLTKQRWNIGLGGKIWHVDKFLETNPHAVAHGLWLAEIELQDESEEFLRPEWLLEEVTHDSTYSNVNLAAPMMLPLAVERAQIVNFS